MSPTGAHRRALLTAGLGAVLPAAAAMLSVDNDWGEAPWHWRCRVRSLGTQPLWLLTWNTPFEDGWWAPLGRLTRDGLALPYEGPQAKRGEPERADYLRLAAGERLEAVRDLAQVHDVHSPGAYRFETTWHWLDAFHGAQAPRPRERHRALAVRGAVLTRTVR